MRAFVRSSALLTRQSAILPSTTVLLSSMRLNATAANTAGAGSPRSSAYSTQQRSSPVNFKRLPPAFDIPRWSEDKSKGYCLRVSYTENSVVLTYINQHGDLVAGDSATKSHLRGERLVSVYLPNVYIARFLAVLEGSMEKCEIASRQTTGTFSVGTEAHHFRLACKSSIGNDTLEWAMDLEPPTALMLQRFLTQSLHFNCGFLK